MGEARQRRGHRRSLGPCREAIARRVLHESCLHVQLDAVKKTKRLSRMNLAGGVGSGDKEMLLTVYGLFPRRDMSVGS